jgi:hypothetical protein
MHWMRLLLSKGLLACVEVNMGSERQMFTPTFTLPTSQRGLQIPQPSEASSITTKLKPNMSTSSVTLETAPN